MVTTLNITLDDSVADRARDVKDEHDLTWPEFVEAATEALEEQEQHDNNESPPLELESQPRVHEEEPVIGQDPIGLEHTDIDVPGSGDLEQRRKETIIEMAELLRDRGTAEKSDFLEVVDADRVDYASEESFWSNCVKGRESLKAIPGVQKPPRGRTVWEWVGTKEFENR